MVRYPPDRFSHANWLLDSLVYGYALQEASLPFDTADEFADVAEDVFLPQLPPDEFPYLINASAATLLAAGYDPAEFIFGLDPVLAALELLRASESFCIAMLTGPGPQPTPRRWTSRCGW